MRHRIHSLEGVSYHNAIPENNGQTMHSLEQLHSNISILYYNARSILPKLDCLRAEAAVKNPSIICIVETWLSDNISDREISIENYHIVRADRNRHGGGVLVYIHNALSWEILLKDANDLEFIALSVSSGITNTVKHCVSVLYRPPSAPVSFFDNFYNTLLSLMSLRSPAPLHMLTW